MTQRARYSILLLGLAGCNDPEDLRLLDIDDGAYLRGAQVSPVDVSAVIGDRQAERVALYLDGARIAEDDFAPFALSWDTRDFNDGSHELRARVVLDDGAYFDEAISISIDNTPPVLLLDPPTVATHGKLYFISAIDNLGVRQVEISRTDDDQPPIVVARADELMWPWGCDQVPLQVRVVDHAGGEATATVQVTSGEQDGDHDCDGHTVDCNDLDATINPGAPEYPDGVDRNCDGASGILEGVDADHDGVASFDSGGADCDDADPSIHGPFWVLGRDDLYMNGPVRWNRGEAALAGFAAGWQLFLNRGGVVTEVVRKPNNALSLKQLATDANPASIAARGAHVAFGRGNQVVVLERSGMAWAPHTTIDGGGPVGKVAYLPPYLGAEYAVFQAGTQVWFASSNGTAWSKQLLIDAGAPLAEPPILSAAPYGANVVFRTATAAWHSVREGTTGPLTTSSLGPTTAVTSAIALYQSYGPLVAVDRPGGGSALHGYQLSSGPLTFPHRITGMTTILPYLFVQLAGSNLEVLDVEHGYRRVQRIPSVVAFDAAAGRAFAGDGRIYYEATASTVHAPPDAAGDNIDRDCDGFDY